MIPAHVRELTPYLEKKLDELVCSCTEVSERRGAGFMQGLVITGRPVSSVVNEALKNGLLVISAGADVLRIVPPLIITRTQIDEMTGILKKCLH